MTDRITGFAVNSARWLSLEDFEGELWKGVKGYESTYLVSNLGRVKSLSRRIIMKSRSGTLSHRDYDSRILKAHDNNKGYLFVIVGGRKHESFYIHRLVADVFLPNPHNKPEIDHVNTNRGDNRAVNLKWVTKSENRKNPITYQKQKIVQGRPIVMLDCWGEYICEFSGAQEASDFLGIGRTVVGEALRRKRKCMLAHGYQFIDKELYDPQKDYTFIYPRGKSPFVNVPSNMMILSFNNDNLNRVFANSTEAATCYGITIGAICKRCREDFFVERQFSWKSTKNRDKLMFYKDADDITKKKALQLFRQQYGSTRRY